jgi:thiamine-phosphate pyrophosphorylase
LLGDEAIIGLTVETIDELRAAEDLDVDYLGLQIFPSQTTKPNHRQVWGLEGLERARSLSRHRFVALGGIKLANLEEVCLRLRLGKRGDGIAMCGELWRGKNPEVVAQKIEAVMKKFAALQSNKRET